MATRVNILIDQGTDFTTSVSLTDNNGAQLDLTGMTAASQIRKTHSSSNSTSFTTALANNTGTLTLSLNNSVTSSLSAGRYVYDVTLEDSGGFKYKVVEGMVVVRAGVTR